MIEAWEKRKEPLSVGWKGVLQIIFYHWQKGASETPYKLDSLNAKRFAWLSEVI